MGLQFMNTKDSTDLDPNTSKRLSFTSPFHEGTKIFKNIHSLLKSSSKKDSQSPLQEKDAKDKMYIDDDSISDELLIASPSRNKSKSKLNYKTVDRLPLHDISDSVINTLANMDRSQRYDDEQSLDKHILNLKIDNPLNAPLLSSFNSLGSNTNTVNRNNSANHDSYFDSDDLIVNNITISLPNKQDNRILKTRSNSLRRIQSTSSHKDTENHCRSKYPARKRNNSMAIEVKNLYGKVTLNNTQKRDRISNNKVEYETTNITAEGPSSLFDSVLSESNILFYHNNDKNTKDNFPRISPSTLNEIIDNKIYEPHYQSYIIIDTRFSYEFFGGHVKNALNISTKDDIEWELLNESRIKSNANQKPILVIFHCEFSCFRSPILASHLRNCDRILNFESYPSLLYPDIVILDGGYKSFFDKYSLQCFPCNYISMDSQENVVNRGQELHKFRSESRKVVSRSNSLYRLSSISRSNSALRNSTSHNNNRAEFSKSNLFIAKTEDCSVNPFQVNFKPPPPRSIFTKGSSYSSKESIYNSSPTSRSSFYSILDSANDLSVFNQNKPEDTEDNFFAEEMPISSGTNEASLTLHEADERDLTVCLEEQ
ncbi:hypothetical protein TPHA_0C02590 [Tetrapisispora phaffii CBS 4417]|uniref:M-phase inducer phosphatase n=1 Tax=Tetrapisispora phaffii (strain ATCC 24235 / CBS 4417 / NBRC 1672 / NRRL Y-8282 / UCD 70-5) TaxID=1071381 RepID=G8BRN6_TETPH|nr:hypothetical protein TPHA_0C02590 [Tetrapisispora phaffii CBS 4417]CCE62412.1 hypothetical protein TPHA_0C02590 [Tetrapisispora phaffii CBS 4417]